MVFTASEKRINPKKIQPGNREWVTIIQGICAAGWAIPPFVIFSGKVLISSWYAGMPRDWAIEVSPNGWTTDELALKWLKYFDAHTKEHTVGAYRLLIVDGHGSHNTKEFHEYYEEQKIIVLCMPPHSSHLLQPLDVGCFAPMKRAYYTEIESWSRYAGTQVKKETFLPAFRIAFDKAINALTEQRSRKRKYIRTEESLTVGDVQDLMAGKDGGDGEAAEQSAKRVRAQRHCGRCGKTGHNTRTCTAEIVDSDDSYSSE
jgi:hypothetical protein